MTSGPIARFDEAWQIVRREPLLWLLGFPAALSGDLLSSIRIGPQLNLSGTGDLLQANILDINSWLRALRLLGGSLVVASIITAVVAVVVLALVLSARAGLIQTTRDLEGRVLTPDAPAARREGAAGIGRRAGPGSPLDAWRADISAALRRGATHLGPLLRLTVLVYGPFLLASEVAGLILRPAPGILKLPVYLILLALLLIGAALPFFYALASCAIVLDGCTAGQAPERAWQTVRARSGEMPAVMALLLVVVLLCNGLAHFVFGPVAGVSLLSLLLTILRGVFPNLGQVFGLLVLGALATALAAPGALFTHVVLTLAYRPAPR